MSSWQIARAERADKHKVNEHELAVLRGLPGHSRGAHRETSSALLTVFNAYKTLFNNKRSGSPKCLAVSTLVGAVPPACRRRRRRAAPPHQDWQVDGSDRGEQQHGPDEMCQSSSHQLVWWKGNYRKGPMKIKKNKPDNQKPQWGRGGWG